MSTSTPRNIPRPAKLIDLGGVILLVIGIACYARAYIGLEALRAKGIGPGGEQFANLIEYERMYQVSRLGLGIAGFAIVVFIVGAVVTWRAKRAVVAAEPVAVLEGGS